jgi:hypothetical protein
MKSLYQNDTWTPMFKAEVFTIAKVWNQPRCPSMYEKSGIYTMEY